MYKLIRCVLEHCSLETWNQSAGLYIARDMDAGATNVAFLFHISSDSRTVWCIMTHNVLQTSCEYQPAVMEARTSHMAEQSNGHSGK